MLQSKLKKAKETSEEKLAAIKNSFEELKAAEIQEVEVIKDRAPKTRVIKLRVGETCGCGGGWVTIEREVPFDSSLVDGDIVEDYEDTDIIMDDD